MDAIVDAGGLRLDLLVRAGTDMPTLTLELAGDDGVATDLTGSTVTARGLTRGDAPVAVVMTVTVVGSPVAGTVTLDLARAEVARMAAPLSLAGRVGATWVMERLTPGGRVLPVLYGEIRVGGTA